MRKKKRSDINEDEVTTYTDLIIDCMKKYAKCRIFNMDETPWNFIYLHGKVLAYRAAEEVNEIYCSFNNLIGW